MKRTSLQTIISTAGSDMTGETPRIGFQIHCNGIIFHDINPKKLVLREERGYNVSYNLSEVVSLASRIEEYGVYGGRPFKRSFLSEVLEPLIDFVEGMRPNPDLLSAVSRVNYALCVA